jgi:hypothetical protein
MQLQAVGVPGPSRSTALKATLDFFLYPCICCKPSI